MPFTPDEPPLAASGDEADTGTSATRPRTRWAAILWGLVFAALAVAGIQLVSSPERFDQMLDWLAALTAPAVIAYALLTVGVLVLVAGLVGLLRRAHVLLAARR
ncbi:hypothetical protein GCM10022382_32260 [Microbacterium invictum]